MAYELKLQSRYFEAIKSVKKKYEGRLGNKKDEIKKSLLINFVNNQTREIITKRVTSVELFDNFEEMLKDRFELFLPDCKSLEEAVEIYHSIPNYKERVKEFGALAIELENPRNYSLLVIISLFFLND